MEGRGEDRVIEARAPGPGAPGPPGPEGELTLLQPEMTQAIKRQKRGSRHLHGWLKELEQFIERPHPR